MSKAIVVYESVYGNTKRLAEAIRDGILQAGKIECKIAKTGEIHTEELCDFDIILFGCPNHNQAPALNLMKFIDRASIVHLKGKTGGAFDTYTGGNKGVALTKLEAELKKKMPGIRMVTSGLSAKVESRRGPLADAELTAAKEFGKKIAELSST
jgi:flavorubredoxin